MFYGGLRQYLHHQHVYSNVPRVNRDNTPESEWIHLKVGLQCVLFLVRCSSLVQAIRAWSGLYVEVCFGKAAFQSSQLHHWRNGQSMTYFCSGRMFWLTYFAVTYLSMLIVRLAVEWWDQRLRSWCLWWLDFYWMLANLGLAQPDTIFFGYLV